LAINFLKIRFSQGAEVIHRQKASEGRFADFAKAIEFESRNKGLQEKVISSFMMGLCRLV